MHRFLPPVAAAADPAAMLLRQGFAILRQVVTPDAIAEIEADLAERFEATPFCDGDFYGRRTKRFGRLLLRSPRMAELVLQTRLRALVDAALGPWCERIQLNLTQAIELHPGAPAQFAHRDQDMWQGVKGEMEYLVNVMWPLTPFMEEDYRFGRWTALASKITSFHRRRAGQAGRLIADLRPRSDPLAT